MRSYLGFDPIDALKVRLRTSAPAYRKPIQVGEKEVHELWTIYNQSRLWSGVEAAEVWDRFVKVRHSFAHQDSSVTLFSKREVATLRDSLAARKASTREEIDFVERTTAVVAVRVLNPSPHPDDPVHDWRLHETQTINSLLAAAGFISSMAEGLADYLDGVGGAARADFEPLYLGVEEGDWLSLAGSDLAESPCSVSWKFLPYRPNSRNL